MRPFLSSGLLLVLGCSLPFAGAQTSEMHTGDTHSADVLAPDAPASAQATASQGVPANYRPEMPITYISSLGSTYVPMDSWIYPALDRLHGMGYLDTAFLGMRPWTRLSIVHMLQETNSKLDAHPDDEQAEEIFLALRKEFASDEEGITGQHVAHAEFESVYSDFRGITGTPLRDSFHLGQTVINDYGRPYQEGFNDYTGFSTRAEAGRFSLYFRGEYQHAPGAVGYSQSLADYLASRERLNYTDTPVQDTIPLGPIAEQNPFRVMEASLSYHLLGHEISFGKNDHWLSPAAGGAMSWSTNAENIYTFDINRVEPLRIPGVSRLIGPIRYEFFVGSLKGHSAPNDPWVHAEKISFKPTKNLEFGFERTVIWGGKGRLCFNTQTSSYSACDVPITIHTFLKSFFSVQNVTAQEKFSRDDPGARFGSFDFNYRLPFVRNWLTLYSDSEAHDDVNPISAPRRSGFRPGIYLSHTPGLPQLDLRVEAADTMPVSDANSPGFFLYNEGVQVQGTTNKGFLFSDWIGRAGKGGQAWLTYHLSPNENIQFAYRNAKVDQDFIKYGTTQNLYTVSAVKRVMKDIEIRGSVQHEEWKAPIYKTGQQSDTLIEGQFTWYPKIGSKFEKKY